MLYSRNKNNKYRFVLGEQGQKTLACLGINPSTAKPEKLDRTMGSVKRIAYNNGYEGWVMFNVYPQRATNPEDLNKSLNLNYHRENLKQVKKSIEELNIKTLWLAYGDLIEYRSYLPHCLHDLHLAIRSLNLNYVIVDQPTIKGHPKHPLYKPANSILHAFNFDNYISSVIVPLTTKK